MELTFFLNFENEIIPVESKNQIPKTTFALLHPPFFPYLFHNKKNIWQFCDKFCGEVNLVFIWS